MDNSPNESLNQEPRSPRSYSLRKQVIVTGGAGFLGSHLIDRLVDASNDVLCIDSLFTGTKDNIAHLHDHPNFKFIRQDVTFPLYVEAEEVLNLACPAAPVHYQHDPVQTTKTSVHAAISMLGLPKRLKCPMFQASTSEVYGDWEVHPQIVDYRGTVKPIGYRSTYDENKHCAEILFFNYHRQNGVFIEIPHIQHLRARASSPTTAAWPRNSSWGTCRRKTDHLRQRPAASSFYYADDLIHCSLKLMDSDENDTGAINLGTPREISIKTRAETIIDLSGSNSKLNKDPLPADDPTQPCHDITRAKQQLHLEAKVKLEDELKPTPKYFEDLIG